MKTKLGKIFLVGITCLVLSSMAALSVKLHTLQVATATKITTPFVTATVGTSTNTHTATASATPVPSHTPTPTVTPTEANLQPTSPSAEDIHLEFVNDFADINSKLDKIYNEVDSPPGWFLVENLVSDYIYDLINPSPAVGGATYLLIKLLGFLGVLVKAAIAMVRLVGRDKQKYPFLDRIATFIVFLYALVFLLVLYFPPNLQQEVQPGTVSEQPPLGQLDRKLDEILTMLVTNITPQPSTGAVTGGNVDLTSLRSDLTTISGQLDEMSIQDQQAISGINQQIDELSSQIQETKSATAKRGWLFVNTLLLLAIFVLIFFSVNYSSLTRSRY